MDFRLNCPCGNSIVVTEGSAGAAIECRCGRTISVPRLKELRLGAGLSPYQVSPELVIEQLLESGQLPGSDMCVVCGKETDETVTILTICEQSWTRRRGGFSWALFIVSAVFLPITIWHWQKRTDTVLGKDKVYPLPLPVCAACRPALQRRTAIKNSLRKIPDYGQLLDKFPRARVKILS